MGTEYSCDVPVLIVMSTSWISDRDVHRNPWDLMDPNTRLEYSSKVKFHTNLVQPILGARIPDLIRRIQAVHLFERADGHCGLKTPPSRAKECLYGEISQPLIFLMILTRSNRHYLAPIIDRPQNICRIANRNRTQKYR